MNRTIKIQSRYVKQYLDAIRIDMLKEELESKVKDEGMSVL